MRKLRTEDEIIANWKDINKNPVVSICCITYNHESYLEDAIAGFLIQETSFPFEILIYDDASSDRTADIIREYEAKYPRLVKPIYQTENQYSKGLKMNPTFNFPRAKGKYIAMCDGDDYWVDESKLEKQVCFLEKEPSYSICYTDLETIDNKGNDLAIYLGGARKDLTDFELKIGTPISTSTTCFRNFFLEVGYPEELRRAAYGDVTFWTILGCYGKGKYLKDILPSKYRVHPNSNHSSLSIKEKKYEKVFNDLAKYKFLLNQGKYSAAYFNLFNVFIFVMKEMGVNWFLRSFYNKLISKLKSIYHNFI